MDQPYPHILRALMSWYRDQQDRGVADDRLPNIDDLKTIAATPGVTRLMLAALPLVDEAALMPYASGVMMTVRTARQAYAEIPPRPPAPPEPAVVPAPTPDPIAVIEPPRPAEPVAPSAPDEPSTSTRAARAQARARLAAPDGPGAEPGTFAAFDLLQPTRPAFVLTPELQQREGGTRIGWAAPPEADAVALYRVVSSDAAPPWNPDEAQLIAVTSATEIHDPRPLPVAVRYVQVWVHTGPDEATARAAQPALLRAGSLLSPPTQVECGEDNGSVILSWKLAPGLTRVELSRVTVGALHTTGFDDADLLVTQAGPTSFHDTTCLPGLEYEYRLCSVLRNPTTGQELLSDPLRFRVHIRSALTPVAEIQVIERHEGTRTLMDLQWDHPSGSEVRIYRTSQPPVIGAALQDIALSALSGAGLTDADLQRLPVTVTAGLGRMQAVAWPDDLPRVHLTAVTVSGSDARVGATATRNRTTAVSAVRLVQRARWQLLTFDWPPGTVSVDVHQTAPGTALEDGPRPPSRSLSEADYRRDGGIRVELPWNGCAVHLVPVSFYEGRPVKGTTTTVAYPGLLLLRYRVTTADVPVTSSRPGGRRLGKRFGQNQAAPTVTPSTVRTLEVMRLSRGPGPAHVQVLCTLVGRPDRIPLSVQDGKYLGETTVTISTDEAAGWQPVGPSIDFAAHRGLHVRLFARLDPTVGFGVALLDPAFESLRVP